MTRGKVSMKVSVWVGQGQENFSKSKKVRVRVKTRLGLLDRTTWATGQDSREGFYDGFYIRVKTRLGLSTSCPSCDDA